MKKYSGDDLLIEEKIDRMYGIMKDDDGDEDDYDDLFKEEYVYEDNEDAFDPEMYEYDDEDIDYGGFE